MWIIGAEYGTIVLVSYHIEIETRAAQTLVRLAQGDRVSAKRIDSAIKSLAEDPRPGKATKLVGADAWRVRVGDYRVIYLIDDVVTVVTVTKIGHRRDVYER